MEKQRGRLTAWWGYTLIVWTVLLCGWKNDAKAETISVLQIKKALRDTPPPVASDTMLVSPAADSLTKPFFTADSIVGNDTLNVAADAGALDAPVNYDARDSIVYDIENKKVYLYGDASVVYKDITLEAAIIVFDWTTNAVRARALFTDTGVVGKPVFSQGDESYSADSLAYNFQTRKGRISELLTKQDEGYLHSEVVKRAGGESYYGLNNKYTTCNYSKPDYYIKTKKIKVIPKKIIVTGPANLVVADVPTPLFVPFGMFPINEKRSSGLIFPEYGERAGLGFYLGNGGYYFAISDYVDLAATGTIYSRGSWGFNLGSHYAKRYKYSGNTVIRYLQERQLSTETGEISKNNLFNVTATFLRDAKANPNYRFNANINFQANRYNQRLAYDPARRLNNQYNSSISYQRIFRNKPFNFSISANHNQNSQSGDMTIGLPEATFGVSQIYPFKRREVVGKQRWYEKITLSYTMNAKNYFQGKDSLLFNSDDLNVVMNNLSRASNYGAQHTLPISTNLNLFKHLTVTPNVTFSQWFYGRTVSHTWNEDSMRVERDTINEFATAYQYSAGVNTQTRLYGMYQFKRGKIQAIRHVINPSLSFSYRPDFAEDRYHSYDVIVTDVVNRYSRFENGIYGGPGQGLQGIVGFNLGNNLEMKVASKKDTISGVKKISLLDRFDFGTGYNLADSLHWQSITMRGNTKLFNLLNVNFNAAWDPYVFDTATLRRVNKLEINENNRLARLTNAQVALGGDFSFGKKKKAPTSSKGTPDEWDMLLKYPDYFVDFNVPLNISANYVLNIRRIINESGDTTTFNQSVNLRLDMNLTKNWKINVTTNYDIKNKEFTSTFIEVFRDLHCWQMRFGWVPIGPFQSYNFDLRVKSALLQDLKISRRKGWSDIGY